MPPRRNLTHLCFLRGSAGTGTTTSSRIASSSCASSYTVNTNLRGFRNRTACRGWGLHWSRVLVVAKTRVSLVYGCSIRKDCNECQAAFTCSQDQVRASCAQTCAIPV